MVKRKGNSTIEQQTCKGPKKRKLIIRYPSEIKILPIDPILSNWVNFNNKMSLINCSSNSKSFKAIYLFRNSKVEDL